MTVTYDPKHPDYRDEADVRGEITRVFDVCQRCRQCTSLCAAFPTLFEMLDRFDDHDPGRLTPSQQDRVIDACHQCRMCESACPFAPSRSELAVDVPRLVLRARAMRRDTGQLRVRRLVNAQTVATVAPRFANRLVGAPPGSMARRLTSALSGISPVRLVAPFARQRFSTWFERRTPASGRTRQGSVTLVPTCLVEHHQPAVGRDIVRVLEHNGIECELSAAQCCGAPWLHAGDIDHFARIARRNVETLAAEVRRDADIVVAQPTCTLVIQQAYPEHVGGADAALVAASTFDASEFLMRLHDDPGSAFDTAFVGDRPMQVSYHAPCHVRVRRSGLPGRDLVVLTGARVELVEQCSGSGSGCGSVSGDESAALRAAAALGDRVARPGGDVVVGDCLVANTAVTEQTGLVPVHPVSIIARAYGIPGD